MKDNKQQNSLVPELRFAEFVGDGEWEEKTLGEVCKMQAGKFVRASEIKEILSDGLFPCFGGNGLRGYVESNTHIGKYSLIGRQGALCGNVTLADGIFHATEHAVVVMPKNKTDTLWLFYELELLNLNQYATGQAQPGLSVRNLERVKLSIPSPQEQQKIATTLSSLDALLQAETERLALLKEHKKGLLQQLFPKQGEKVPQLRFVEFVGDGVWEEKALSNLITNISPPKKLKSSQFQEKGKYPIIDQSQKEIAGWSNDEKAIVKNKFPLIIFGDHTCILKIAEKPFIQGADGIKIFKGSTLVETRYLYYALQSNPIVMKEYKRHYSILKEKIFSYPNIDSGEQQKIANTLSSVDELIETQSEKIATLKAHKKGLLQGMFPEINTL